MAAPEAPTRSHSGLTSGQTFFLADTDASNHWPEDRPAAPSGLDRSGPGGLKGPLDPPALGGAFAALLDFS